MLNPAKAALITKPEQTHCTLKKKKATTRFQSFIKISYPSVFERLQNILLIKGENVQ